MSRLPSLTARKIVRALKKAGFIEERQKGSHLILIHPETYARTVVPMHSGRPLKKSLLHAIIVDDARLPIKDFIKFL